MEYSLVVVRNGQRSVLGDPCVGIREDIVSFYREAVVIGIQVGHDSQSDVGEDVAFDEDLGAHAAVDAGGGDVGEDAVVDVPRPETKGGQAGVDIVPASEGFYHKGFRVK